MMSAKNIASMKLLSLLRLSFLMSVMFHHRWVHSMPASPLAFKEILPDGTTITLRIDGDEFEHYERDLNGFTTIRGNDGYRYYAEQFSNGELHPSHLRVDQVDPLSMGLAPGLRDRAPRNCGALYCPGQLPPSSRIGSHARNKETNIFIKDGHQRRLGQKVDKNVTTPIEATTPATSSFNSRHRSMYQTKGLLKNLVIPIRFKDHATRSLPSRNELDTLFNHVGAHPTYCPTGSVRDVFYENSYGQLELESYIVDWVNVSYTEAQASGGSAGFGFSLFTPMIEALRSADEQVDFQDFDLDGDNEIDAITFLHSGYAAEFGGTSDDGAYYLDRIWSHKWQHINFYSQDGVRVDRYHINPALWHTYGNQIGRIAVIAHETSHFLGLPDLYDTDSGGSGQEVGSGIGSWGLMGNAWGFNGDQLHPPHLCAWSKLFLGWLTPQRVDIGWNFVLATAEDGDQARGPRVIKIGDGQDGFPPDEYLLIENRHPIGFDAAIPDEGGLLILHVDDTAGYNRQGYPGQWNWPNNGNHYRVAVVQADGKYDLEKSKNRGDINDVFHYYGVDELGPSKFNSDPNTSQTLSGPYPNTDSYQGGYVYRTGNELSQIAAPAVNMSFWFTNETEFTVSPSFPPFSAPSMDPSSSPSTSPSSAPSTLSPASSPIQPSSEKSSSPSDVPSILLSLQPSSSPSLPSDAPSHNPSWMHYMTPSSSPSKIRSQVPSSVPSDSPSRTPFTIPSTVPSSSPSLPPVYTQNPSRMNTSTPKSLASNSPSSVPSWQPSTVPSLSPSDLPSITSFLFPSVMPSSSPSSTPSLRPSVAPSAVPQTCGNGIKEGSEVCDDNNQNEGDGCSGDCMTLEEVEIKDMEVGPFDVSETIDVRVLEDQENDEFVCCGYLFLRSVSTSSPGLVYFVPTTSRIDLTDPLRSTIGTIRYHPFFPDPYNFPVGDSVVSIDYKAVNHYGVESTKTVTVTLNRQPVCGDGRVEGAETCDDMNLADGDGCSSDCMLEPIAIRNYMGTVDASDGIDIRVLEDEETGELVCCGNLFITSVSTPKPNLGLVLVQLDTSNPFRGATQMLQYHPYVPATTQFSRGETVVEFNYTVTNHLGADATRVAQVTVNRS